MPNGTLKSGSWVLLDNLAAAGIAFGFFVVTARLLSPMEFGVAAVAVSVSQILLPLIDSLFHDAVIQREDLAPDDVQTAFTATLLWSLVVAAAIVLLSPAMAYLTNAPSLSRYLPWMAISALASGVMAVPTALARRGMMFRALAIRTVLGRSIAAVVGLWLAFAGYGVWAVVVQAVLASVLAAAFLVVAMRPSLRLMLDRARLQSMLRFAGPAMGTQLLLFASSRIFTLIFSALLGPVAAATWNVALRFVEPLQLVAATALGQFTLPIYARKQNNPEELRTLFLVGSRRASLVLLPMFVGLSSCAYPVIELLVGPQWLAAAAPMAVICLVFAIIASRQLVEIMLTSLGLPQLNLLIQAVAIALSLGGFALLASQGLVAATLGWSLRMLPFVLLAAVLMRRRAGVGARAQFAAVAPAYAASGLMAAGVIGVQHLLAGWPPAGLLAGSVATGVLFYAPLALALDPEARTVLADLRHARASGEVTVEAIVD